MGKVVVATLGQHKGFLLKVGGKSEKSPDNDSRPKSKLATSTPQVRSIAT